MRARTTARASNAACANSTRARVKLSVPNVASAQHTQAVLLAASRLELLRAEGDWSTGETEGKAETFRWRQTIAATPVEGLHEVKVAVSRPPSEAPVFSLTTLLYQAPSDLPSGKDKATDATRARRKNRRNP